MINVYDMDRKRIAVLQNAYSIKEEQELNGIYSFSFQLPSTDEKMAYCMPFYYFRYNEDGELYRQIKNPRKNTDVPVSTISCEHVIATLCDNVLFGSHTVGGTGMHTADVINYILSKQTVQNWVLGECDFDRQFQYNWEQENLLNALYSIPNVFTESYIWTFNTHVYPWRVSLKRLDVNAAPSYYIRAGRNLISSSADIDYTNICTRLYPLGYGEGVNQLNIKDINNGVPYLEAPAAVIARYGIKEKVLVDRRFENAESLMSYGQAVLDELTTPSLSRTFDVVDLYEITNNDIDNAQIGRVCRMTEDDSTACITKTTRILDQAGNLKISLSTKPSDVASAIADMAERIRIESVYAQGATQLYQHSKDANATPNMGMILSMYFPGEMRQINKVLLRLKLNRFRSYSMTTETNQSREESTENSRQRTVTSSTANGISQQVTSGPSSLKTTNNWRGVGYINTDQTSVERYSDYEDASSHPNHRHYVNLGYHAHRISGSSFSHSHGMDHTHKIEIDISGHSHTVEIPEHSHYFIIPAHTHAIKAGIFESGSPSAFDIYVNGEKRATVDDTSFDDDITMWLLGDDGLVPRNQWIDMEIRPNDNAYVVASVFIQGFIQSRGGGNY